MKLFSSADLRALADMLDALGEATRRTGVTVDSYSDEHLMLNDHVIRMRWEPGADGAVGRYVVEYPDKN